MHFPPDAAEGVRLFNEQRYFEAHDVLEEIWLGRIGDEKTFYQGLIQIAVGFYKVGVANQGGATSLLQKGLAKLRAVAHLESPLDMTRLIQETGSALERIEQLGQSRIGEFDPATAPRIHWRPVGG